MVHAREVWDSARPGWPARGAPALCLMLLVTAACDGNAERRTLRDSGLACIEMSATPFADCSVRAIAAGTPLAVEVDFGTCTSSSCDRVLNAACRTTVSGSVITIEAEAVIESEGSECTDDCGFVSARCEIEPLPAGTYELRYGNDSVSLTVPSNTVAGCVGDDVRARCCETSEDCNGGACESQRCR